MALTSNKSRCRCTKSKCLKLYCICFAAGFYCDESCSCGECFNSLDYEDTVDIKRQQLKLKQPLAFSPKIQPPSGDNEDVGKHKKGCNCKKSMCAKKYCECYQANVGCSAECRCEGCQNVFGMKGDCDKKEIYPFHMCSNEIDTSPYEFNNHHNLTNCAAFQHLGHENSTSDNSWTSCLNSGHENNPSTSGRYISPSFECDNFDMIQSDQQSSYPNDEFMNKFTPPDSTEFDIKHPAFMNNLPPMMSYSPNISRSSEIISDVMSWHGSRVDPVSLFGGPKVNDSNDMHIDIIHDNTPFVTF